FLCRHQVLLKVTFLSFIIKLRLYPRVLILKKLNCRQMAIKTVNLHLPMQGCLFPAGETPGNLYNIYWIQVKILSTIYTPKLKICWMNILVSLKVKLFVMTLFQERAY